MSQSRDTVQGSSGSGSVIHSVPLMQGVGASPAPGGLTGTPLLRASLAAVLLLPNLIPVNDISAVTPQPQLSMFHSNTIPGGSSWLQIHSDNECIKSTSAKGL